MTERRIAELWAEVPTIACKGRCPSSCGPIDASRAERRILREHGIRLRALPLLDVACGEVRTCPALVDGRCSVYAVRPLICRLWGVVESMPCPWGCKPERYLSDAQARALLLAAARLRGDVATETETAP